MKKVLITGCLGYVGYPLVVELYNKGYKVIGVDNDYRNEWVEKCGGERFWEYCHCDNSYTYIKGNLTNRDFVNEILAIHKPDVIIHLASQPSMPYSQLSSERALFTQLNNLSMCVNLLWGIKENEPQTKFIITTTTGIAGQYYETISEKPVINMAGSYYHISRGFDSANCSLASRQWGQEVIEFRTSIVYGLQTELLKEHGLATRFDTDPYFGTALNRFVSQAIKGEPLTVYGKGEQEKPFISLEDTVKSLANAIDYQFSDRHTILNQTTRNISINQLAEVIKKHTNCEIFHLPNPRIEKEDFKMVFENEKFLKVLGTQPTDFEKDIEEMIKYLRGNH